MGAPPDETKGYTLLWLMKDPPSNVEAQVMNSQCTRINRLRAKEFEPGARLSWDRLMTILELETSITPTEITKSLSLSPRAAHDEREVAFFRLYVIQT